MYSPSKDVVAKISELRDIRTAIRVHEDSNKAVFAAYKELVAAEAEACERIKKDIKEELPEDSFAGEKTIKTTIASIGLSITKAEIKIYDSMGAFSILGADRFLKIAKVSVKDLEREASGAELEKIPSFEESQIRISL